MKKLHFIALSSLLLAVGCAANPRSAKVAPSNLELTTWQAAQLNEQALTPSGDEFTLTFHTEGRLNGRGACNIMFGTYTLGSAHSLSLSPMGLTRTACPDMEREREYFETLELVTRSEIIDGELLLYNKKELLMQLSPLTYEQQ